MGLRIGHWFTSLLTSCLLREFWPALVHFCTPALPGELECLLRDSDSTVLSENLSSVKYNYLFVETQTDKNLLMLCFNCMFWILPPVVVLWCILDLMLNKIPFLCWRGMNPDLTISDLGQLGEEEPAVTRCWCRGTCARTRRVLFAKESLHARVGYLANIVPRFLLSLTSQKHVGVRLCTTMRVWHLSVANVA